ncbi:hypothetical protein SELMODRAFT_418204 [Selaginella moellendorffii]|uniref:Uncharacterized protein n=1 Tax=Selaginella moellendorffii TaxID=88036 RepID=D8S503_SELML|nr:hypothetical protein SELMODRAFT_418204 [Selaginella moellendorffii]
MVGWPPGTGVGGPGFNPRPVQIHFPTWYRSYGWMACGRHGLAGRDVVGMDWQVGMCGVFSLGGSVGTVVGMDWQVGMCGVFSLGGSVGTKLNMVSELWLDGLW